MGVHGGDAGVVSEAENAAAGQMLGQEVIQPVDTARRYERLNTMSTKAVDGNDASRHVS